MTTVSVPSALKMYPSSAPERKRMLANVAVVESLAMSAATNTACEASGGIHPAGIVVTAEATVLGVTDVAGRGTPPCSSMTPSTTAMVVVVASTGDATAACELNNEMPQALTTQSNAPRANFTVFSCP